jgi:serine/threonine protein kinase/class 3 adenylate cyclase
MMPRGGRADTHHGAHAMNHGADSFTTLPPQSPMGAAAGGGLMPARAMHSQSHSGESTGNAVGVGGTVGTSTYAGGRETYFDRHRRTALGRSDGAAMPGAAYRPLPGEVAYGSNDGYDIGVFGGGGGGDKTSSFGVSRPSDDDDNANDDSGDNRNRSCSENNEAAMLRAKSRAQNLATIGAVDDKQAMDPDAVSQHPLTSAELRASVMYMEMELATLAAIRAPNVVDVYGRIALKDGSFGIVMELLEGGSLFDHLHNPALEIGPKRAVEFALDAARGVAHLHASHILHRDIKSLNVLVDRRGSGRVADFDLSVRCGEDGMAVTATGTAGATYGSAPWTAAEVWASRGVAHSTRSDVYSLGIVIWECITRREPFEDCTTRRQIMRRVLRGIRPDIPPHCPARVAALIRRCWAGDAARRPSARAVVEELLAVWTELPEDVTSAADGSLTIQCAQSVLGRETVAAMQGVMLRDGVRPGPVVTPENVTVLFAHVGGMRALAMHVSPADISEIMGLVSSRFTELARRHGSHVFRCSGGSWILLTVGVSHELRTVTLATELCATADEIGQIAAGLAANDGGRGGGRAAGGGGGGGGGGGINSPGPASTYTTTGSRTSLFSGMGSQQLRSLLYVRAGVNTGTVTAQMVSATALEFVGDTINVTARLEATAARGAVHLSAATAAMVEGRFRMAKQVPLAIRGRGFVVTYQILNAGETAADSVRRPSILSPAGPQPQAMRISLGVVL